LAGTKVSFSTANPNTGATTLNVNSVGAIALVLNDGTALIGGEIIANGIYECVYSLTGNWHLLNPS